MPVGWYLDILSNILKRSRSQGKSEVRKVSLIVPWMNGLFSILLKTQANYHSFRLPSGLDCAFSYLSQCSLSGYLFLYVMICDTTHTMQISWSLLYLLCCSVEPLFKCYYVWESLVLDLADVAPKRHSSW